MSQVWNMQLTESMNTYFNVRVAHTIRVTIKETFMGNDSFCKFICGKWTGAREYKIYYLTNLVREGRNPGTLGNP